MSARSASPRLDSTPRLDRSPRLDRTIVVVPMAPGSAPEMARALSGEGALVVVVAPGPASAEHEAAGEMAAQIEAANGRVAVFCAEGAGDVDTEALIEFLAEMGGGAT